MITALEAEVPAGHEAPDSAAHPASNSAPPSPSKPSSAPRKRTRNESTESPDLPGLSVADEPATATTLEVSDERGPSSGETGELERSLSADGVTRLTVTAYIGIGNRLFVRGEGPGLSREKGVPLHFVSIGKWRWESTDATDPVRLRVYKNDQLECPGLGEITLDPGQQGEVTANF